MRPHLEMSEPGVLPPLYSPGLLHTQIVKEDGWSTQKLTRTMRQNRLSHTGGHAGWVVSKLIHKLKVCLFRQDEQCKQVT